MAPREGAQPVCVRLMRSRERGRTDALERIEECLAKVQCRGTSGAQTTHDKRTEAMTKTSQP